MDRTASFLSDEGFYLKSDIPVAIASTRGGGETNNRRFWLIGNYPPDW